MGLDRLPTRALDAERATLGSKLRAWELTLVMIVVAERIVECPDFARASLYTLHAGGGLVLGALYLWGAARRPAVAGLLVLQLSVVVQNLPWTANHHFLELYLLALVVLLDARKENEGRQLLAGARWLIASVLVWAGVQKAVHGYYFGGELLAYCVSYYDGFRAGLGPLLPAAELARLASYEPGEGVGPFRAASAPLVILSNATWLFEIGAGAALLVPRLRVVGVAATAAFLLITQGMARELFFGALFVATLFLFLPHDANRRLVPVFAALLVWILAMKAGLLPGFRHT